MVRADILVRGGTIVDPARGFSGQGDILIRGSRIIEAGAGEEIRADEIIDATGCLVTPGLIDNHAHVYYGGTAVGCEPEATLLPMGVTTVLDAGSTGVETCEAFFRSVASHSRMRVFCSLNVSSEGQTTTLHSEDLNPAAYDRARLGYFLEKYPHIVKGLKVRCTIELVGEYGIAVLGGALEVAQALGTTLTVHTTNPPCDMGDLAMMLRPGDTLCHLYHGRGNTILDAGGHVKEKVRQARRKGVVFDTADGRFNHSYPVIRAALADGFAPDIISSDLTIPSAFSDVVFGLPMVMSKHLELGLPLGEVVRATTATPAATLGLADKIGTLTPGAIADVAVFMLKDKQRRLRNPLGETLVLSKLLVPQMTILDGRVVFRQVDF